MKPSVEMKQIFFSVYLFLIFLTPSVEANGTGAQATQKASENQIRNLLDPLIDKYCHDQCKLMGVSTSVDVSTPDKLAPGFDEMNSIKTSDLTTTSGRVKLLIDDKVGPVSKRKLLDLMQEYLDTLDFPVKIDTQIAHFPIPQGHEGKIAELKQKVSKQFLTTIEDLLRQFCPHHCILADYELKTEIVNAEEANYGSTGEFIQDGTTALKIKDISATILMDESLSSDEQANILEMAKLKANSFRNVSLIGKSLRFPRPVSPKRGLASELSEGGQNANNKNSENTSNSNSTNNSNNVNSETNSKQEKFERIEKIERVESGDAVQVELQKFKVYGLVFACSVVALLIFIAMSVLRPSDSRNGSSVHRVIQSLTSDPTSTSQAGNRPTAETNSKEDDRYSLTKRYEIERLMEELTSIYAQQPRVAKQVFTRVLTEEGVEVTAQCISLFGESIVVEMLRDPSLQSDLNELMEFYAKTTIDMNDEEKLTLLRQLHNRTVAGKLVVLGSRSTHLFDFLAEMDGLQILELVRNESLTVKSIILTQCDPQKRSTIYTQLDADTRMKLLAELSRIDYLPRDYIFNVAAALKRKRKENPKMNTEALPGSEVLVSLLERTGQQMQKTVVKNLEVSSPDSARVVKSKLVSIDTLRYLRDGQLLEVVLSLKHEELIQFLKGTTNDVRSTVFAKSPKELSLELEEELELVGMTSREAYLSIERKVLNRMKIMANEGQINLIETNERMFAESQGDTAFVQTNPGTNGGTQKVAGW